ncbi:MAG: hypothetical protein ACLFOY_01955 [Desulfatibacillaceae bacterium]
MDKYDIVVGIPSYNEAETIGHVAEKASEGLVKYFPDARSIIVNCDNNSPDGTKRAFLSTVTKVEKKYISTEQGVKGKGNNLYNLFGFFLESEARIGIVIDADIRSIVPKWIRYMAGPVKDGCDLVTPVYSRHQFDGTITNHLCHPLVHALTGMDIRQPIGGDFAFSSSLCEHWMKQEWNESVRQYGVDIFMTLHAIFGGFKVCQAGLGSKVHNASAPKLGIMFEQVVHTLFDILAKNRFHWLAECSEEETPRQWATAKTRDVPRYGMNKMPEPQRVEIDMIKLKKDCRAEWDENREHVEKHLSHYAYTILERMFEMDFHHLDIMLWSQIVYTLLCCFEEADEGERGNIVNALKPLYFSRSITFDYQTWRYSVEHAEKEVNDQARAFLSQKPYLLGLNSLKQAKDGGQRGGPAPEK